MTNEELNEIERWLDFTRNEPSVALARIYIKELLDEIRRLSIREGLA